MDNQKLDHAIELHDEIIVLNDILNEATNQPYLDLVFSTLGRDRVTYTMKSGALIHRILTAIRERKIELGKEFEAL